MISGFPKGLIVAVVLLVGIGLVLALNPPHRACTSKLEVLQEAQKGTVYASQGKVLARPPKILGEIETCKLGNSPGACFEFFLTLRGLVRDLQGFSVECADDIKEVSEIRFAIRQGLTLMVQIAWGEEPPEAGIGTVRQGWLEASDLALFCNLKDLETRFFGPEELQELQTSIAAKLPGEKAVFSAGSCVNCDFRKTAPQVFSPHEIWSHSLFAVRCELYR